MKATGKSFLIRECSIMNLNAKNQVEPITKIDYLTVVFTPNEIARLRFDAKLAFGNGDFSSYKEAYNAMLCAEMFNESATDDLDVDINETVVFNSDYYYNELFDINLSGSSKYRQYKSIDEPKRCFCCRS